MEEKITYISKYELQKLIYRIFKFNRSHLRFMRTFVAFAKAIDKEDELVKAYYDAIREEKESLLKILDGQLKYLYKLNAPPMIIASKQQEVDSAKEVVGNLDMRGAKKIFKQELQNLKKTMSEDLMGLTINFCSDGDYPINLLFDDDDDNEGWKHDLIKT